MLIGSETDGRDDRGRSSEAACRDRRNQVTRGPGTGAKDIAKPSARSSAEDDWQQMVLPDPAFYPRNSDKDDD